MTFSLETWLALAYGLSLVLIAYAIDLMARRANDKALGQASGGFVYHEDHDAWLCPEDQWLWPQSFDPDNRVMRYRGSPSVCNACPVKDTCTASHDGREVVRQVDSWPASEAARFHRGIACAVAVLGVIWPIAMALTTTLTESVVLLVWAGILAALTWPLWSHLRRTPAQFPVSVDIQTLDDTVAHRRLIATTILTRGAHYASDRRTDNAS